MTSPLIDRLMAVYGYPRLTSATFDDFVHSHHNTVVFFTEDPRAFGESNDVAVILPELMARFGERATAAVVDRGSERELAKRYRFKTWPALVFLRRGEYLGVITGVQDWPVFLERFEALLDAEPTNPPVPDIPVMTAGQPQGCAGGC